MSPRRRKKYGWLESLHIASNRILRISPALPDLGVDDIALPSLDGSQLFVFDGSGRHLQTRDALTSAGSLTIERAEGTGLPESIRERDLDTNKLIDYALRLDTAIAKRLGWILESVGYETADLARLIQVSIKGYRKLDPTGPRKGRCNRRWKIMENLPGMVTA